MSSTINTAPLEFSEYHRIHKSPWCESLPDPFVGKCKAVLQEQGLCPPIHPRWKSESEKVKVSCKPDLHRSNSVMDAHFFENPVKVDVEVKPENHGCVNITNVVVVSEIDFSLVKPKRKFVWCRCLK